MTARVERISPAILYKLAPRDTAKWTARQFGIAWATARNWLIEGVPQSRREELARTIDVGLRELELRRREIALIRGELEDDNG